MNRKKIFQSILFALLLSAIPSVAYAHDGTNLPLGGFLSGMVHPVLGYDHLLAMLSVGILSAQIGGRAIWTVPATFVSVMALGGLLGLIGIGQPYFCFYSCFYSLGQKIRLIPVAVRP